MWIRRWLSHKDFVTPTLLFARNRAYKTELFHADLFVELVTFLGCKELVEEADAWVWALVTPTSLLGACQG